jgi:beta-lactamase regulating signal transducer with metallopeptidase domain
MLLIVAALLLTCFKKLPSSAKHRFWLALIIAVVLTPFVSLVFPQGVFSFGFQNNEAASAFQILSVVLPQQMDLGRQMKSMTELMAVSVVRQSGGQLFTYPTLCAVLWIIGFMYFLARIVTGIFGINRIRVHARFTANNLTQRMLTIASREFNIQRKVQVLVSQNCRVPFTYGTIRPVILLPTGVSSWPEERLHSVFVHELAHIKRFDSLTQQFARVVCAVFWFMPIVWIAYRNLYMEQEKSCDEYALVKGIEATRYARHVLNIVAFARGRLALTGIYFSRGKRKMLEKRILHVLTSQCRAGVLKKRVLIATIMLCSVLIAPILVLNPLSADDGTYDMQDQEEFFGTWINSEYDESFKNGKMIHTPEGVLHAFDGAADQEEAWNAKYTITDKWMDNEGNVWYKWLLTDCRRGAIKDVNDYCCVSKISDSGRVMEVSRSGNDYHVVMDPDTLKYEYLVYYQQQ